MSKKQIISHLVAAILGLLGGLFGRDLSGLQAPAEKAVEQAVDAVAKAPAAPAPVEAPAPVAPVEAPAPVTPAPVVDAGTPAPAPAPAH